MQKVNFAYVLRYIYLYLEMLKLRKNKWNDLYIFSARGDVQKVTCLTAKFQEEPVEPLREIAW